MIQFWQIVSISLRSSDLLAYSVCTGYLLLFFFFLFSFCLWFYWFLICVLSLFFSLPLFSFFLFWWAELVGYPVFLSQMINFMIHWFHVLFFWSSFILIFFSVDHGIILLWCVILGWHCFVLGSRIYHSILLWSEGFPLRSQQWIWLVSLYAIFLTRLLGAVLFSDIDTNCNTFSS